MSEFFINTSIVSDERYDLSKFMEFTDNYDPITSHFLSEIQSLPQGGIIQVVSDAGRPDNISYKIYNNTQYWWVIMLYNGITEYSDINQGDTINYPTLSSLEDLFFSLKSKGS